MSTSSAIRSELVEARKLDLVGADNHHAFGNELLPDAPSQWYLSGFLVPSEAPADQKTDETSSEEIVSGGNTGGPDDDTEPDRAAARKSILPSSMGLSLSVLVAPCVETQAASRLPPAPEARARVHRSARTRRQAEPISRAQQRRPHPECNRPRRACRRSPFHPFACRRSLRLRFPRQPSPTQQGTQLSRLCLPNLPLAHHAAALHTPP